MGEGWPFGSLGGICPGAVGMHSRKKEKSSSGSGKTRRETHGKEYPEDPVFAGICPGDAAFPVNPGLTVVRFCDRC